MQSGRCGTSDKSEFARRTFQPFPSIQDTAPLLACTPALVSNLVSRSSARSRIEGCSIIISITIVLYYCYCSLLLLFVCIMMYNEGACLNLGAPHWNRKTKVHGAGVDKPFRTLRLQHVSAQCYARSSQRPQFSTWALLLNCFSTCSKVSCT